MIDLWTSRRDMFHKCEYWCAEHNPKYVANNAIGYDSAPDGFFMAKEVRDFFEENQVIGNSFMLSKESVMLVTRDKVDDLKVNDIVKCDGKKYRVENISRSPIHSQEYYMRRGNSFTTQISLVGTNDRNEEY